MAHGQRSGTCYPLAVEAAGLRTSRVVDRRLELQQGTPGPWTSVSNGLQTRSSSNFHTTFGIRMLPPGRAYRSSAVILRQAT